MYQKIAFLLMLSFATFAQKVAAPPDSAPQQAYALYPNGQKVPYVQVIPGGAIYIANGPEMFKGHTVQINTDENHPVVIKPQDGGFWGWFGGEAGAGWLMGIVAVYLAYRQYRMQSQMNEHQKKTDAHNALEAQRATYTPSYLALHQAHRQWESYKRRCESDAIRDYNINQNGPVQSQRPLDDIRRNIFASSKPESDRLTDELYRHVEDIAYLIFRGSITNHEFWRQFRMDMHSLKRDHQQYVYFSSLYNPHPYFYLVYERFQSAPLHEVRFGDLDF